MKTKVLISLLLGSIAMNSYSGQDRGGGDLCEKQIKIVRDDLSNWIKKDGANGLTFPRGVDKSTYDSRMQNEIQSAKIRCVSKGDKGHPVEVYGTPKVCRFDRSVFRSSTITCSRDEFEKLNEDDQYVLIHHEYAGLAGLEAPNRDDSDYALSNQITSFLANMTVRRLVVKPTPTTAEQWITLKEEEGAEVSYTLQKALAKLKFSDCDFHIDNKVEERSCSEGGRKYPIKNYQVASKDHKLRNLDIGEFHCGRLRLIGLAVKSENNKIKWFSEQAYDAVEIVYELEDDGKSIRKATHVYSEIVDLNTGTLTNPSWIKAKQHRYTIECNAIKQ